MLNWIKKGKIFDPRERFEWMHEYAQNPNAIILDDRIRVYFSCRPKRGQDGSCTSRIGFVDFLCAPFHRFQSRNGFVDFRCAPFHRFQSRIGFVDFRCAPFHRFQSRNGFVDCRCAPFPRFQSRNGFVANGAA